MLSKLCSFKNLYLDAFLLIAIPMITISPLSASAENNTCEQNFHYYFEKIEPIYSEVRYKDRIRVVFIDDAGHAYNCFDEMYSKRNWELAKHFYKAEVGRLKKLTENGFLTGGYVCNVWKRTFRDHVKYEIWLPRYSANKNCLSKVLFALGKMGF